MARVAAATPLQPADPQHAAQDERHMDDGGDELAAVGGGTVVLTPGLLQPQPADQGTKPDGGDYGFSGDRWPASLWRSTKYKKWKILASRSEIWISNFVLCVLSNKVINRDLTIM